MPDRQPGHLPDDPRGPTDGPRRSLGPASPGSGGSRWLPLVLAVVAVVAIGWLFSALGSSSRTSLSYTEFLNLVDNGKVASVTIGPNGHVDGERKNGDQFQTTVPTAVPAQDLLPALEKQDVTVTATEPSDGTLGVLLINLLPFVLLIGAFWWFARRARGAMGGAGGGLMDIGRSRAKELTKAERPNVRFDDVAGYDNAKREVREIVDFLEKPDAYKAIGAKGPGGVLLVGPPGTGKTLLARAVAGEAGVPFFAAAGSEFVEMIVGVGASRVRDLFAKARKKAPAIIFIDELDSIGRKRGGTTTIGSHNEQEQTLNQILAEMDGFDPSEGVVVMAATNRAEMLDDALTRPGRFDRTIPVGLPRQDERLAILEVHTRSVALADDVDLGKIARGTPGFSGAELKNLVNEAGVMAVRDERSRIRQADFEAARDRLVLGHREESSILRDDERDRIAVHEAGHAVVGALTPTSDPVSKVTILPSGQALGRTEQLPLEERRLLTQQEMEDRLAVMMGGRVAELEVTEQASSGAANDLAQATRLAGRMVAEFGLSSELGPVGYAGADQNGYTPPALRQRPFAEETQYAIDREVARVLREAEATAHKLVSDHRDVLDRLVARLLEDETVDGDVVYDLLGVTSPNADADDEPTA